MARSRCGRILRRRRGVDALSGWSDAGRSQDDGSPRSRRPAGCIFVHGISMTTAPRAQGRRVLVTHSYYLHYDPKQVRRMKPYAPLGTLLAAAHVRQLGFDVHFFDAMLSAGVQEFIPVLDSADPLVVGILEDNFNFLTKMCTLRMREAAYEMIAHAKARGCRVVVNGSDASDHAEFYLGAGADAVIV